MIIAESSERVCGAGQSSQPAQQSSLRSPRDEVWGSKGVFDNPFVANPFQAGMPAAPPVQRPLSSGPLGEPAAHGAWQICCPSLTFTQPKQ